MLLFEFYTLPLISPKSYHTLPVPMRPDGCALQKKRITNSLIKIIEKMACPVSTYFDYVNFKCSIPTPLLRHVCLGNLPE